MMIKGGGGGLLVLLAELVAWRNTRGQHSDEVSLPSLTADGLLYSDPQEKKHEYRHLNEDLVDW